MTDTATVAGPVAIVREGRIAVVTVDNPPVNALGRAVRQGLWDAVEALDADPSVDAVVLVCAGRTFIAGADVNEFGKAPEPPHLPDLVARIEAARSGRWGGCGALPNSLTSAPAMKVRPAQMRTTASTSESASSVSAASQRDWRRAWPRAFTGGLSTVTTATRPSRSMLTVMLRSPGRLRGCAGQL